MPRQNENTVRFRDNSYSFKIRIDECGDVRAMEECRKTFKVLHGNANRRIINLKNFGMFCGKLLRHTHK